MKKDIAGEKKFTPVPVPIDGDSTIEPSSDSVPGKLSQISQQVSNMQTDAAEKETTIRMNQMSDEETRQHRKSPILRQTSNFMHNGTKVLQGIHGRASHVHRGTKAMMKGVGKGVGTGLSAFADTSKAILGDLKIKSLQALIPALLQDLQDGNLDGVRHLIALAEDKRNTTQLETIKDLEGRNVLHKAAAGGHLAVMDLIIAAINKKCADQIRPKYDLQKRIVNAVDNYGNTPLMVFCMSGAHVDGHVSISEGLENGSTNMILGARTLRQAGAKLNTQKYVTRDNPLHWVAHHVMPDLLTEFTQLDQPDCFWCLLTRNKQNQFPLDVAGIRYTSAKLRDLKYGGPLESQLHTSARSRDISKFRLSVVQFINLGTQALNYFSNKLNELPVSSGASSLSTPPKDNLSISLQVLQKYCAHWLYWASVLGDLEQVKRALYSRHGSKAIQTQIECHRQRTALHAACRYAHPDIVKILIHHERNSVVPDSFGALSVNKKQSPKLDYNTSVLKILDHNRNSVLHSAVIASNSDALLTNARKIVISMTDVALGRNVNLGVSQRNQAALLPSDYAKDPVVYETIEKYARQLHARRSGRMLRSLCRSQIQLVVPVEESTRQRLKIRLDNTDNEVGIKKDVSTSDVRAKLKYVWVLAFAKSIDLPGVQHQYEKVAARLRDVHSGLIIDVIPSVVQNVVGKKNEVFVGIGVAGEAELNYLAEMVNYEARLLQGTVPGEADIFTVEDSRLFEPFRTREREDILLRVIHSVFALQTYVDSGVITRMFPLHDEEEAKLVRESWVDGPPVHAHDQTNPPCGFKYLNRKTSFCHRRQKISSLGKRSSKERSFLSTFFCCLCAAPKSHGAKWQPLGSLHQYFTESIDLDHDALSLLRMYNGEKVAFFYAWICHLTAYLLVIAPVGVGLWLYHLINSVNKSSWVLPYSLITVIWGTIQNKYWKRKQAELAYLWNMRDLSMKESTRPGFRGDVGVEPVTGNIEKVDNVRLRICKQFLNFPFLLCMVAVSVVTFVAFRLFFDYLGRSTGGDPMIYRSLSSIAIGISVTLIDLAYESLAIKITMWENWRTSKGYDFGLVSKLFAFRFINNQATIVWAAYAAHGHPEVVQELAVTVGLVMLAKQATMTAVQIVYPILCFQSAHRVHKERMNKMMAEVEKSKLWLRRKSSDLELSNRAVLTKGNTNTKALGMNLSSQELQNAAVLIQRTFRASRVQHALHLDWAESVKMFQSHYPDVPIMEVWEARAEIEKNAMMTPYFGLLDGYGDTLIMYGFVLQFSCVFPPAAVVALLSNIIYIRFSIDINLRVVQRAVPETARDIGSWEAIASLLTYLAIFSNVALFQFSFGGTFSTSGHPFQDSVVQNTTHLSTNISNSSFFDGSSNSGGPEIESEASTYSQVTEWFDLAFTTPTLRLWALIVLEHMCVVAKILLETFVSNEPQWVKDAVRNHGRASRHQIQSEQAAIERLLQTSNIHESSDLAAKLPGSKEDDANITHRMKKALTSILVKKLGGIKLRGLSSLNRKYD